MHTQTRLLRLDLLRTIAIVGMVLYHAAYDLHTWYGVDIAVLHGGWKILARSTAILFLLLSGASLMIARPTLRLRLRRAGMVGLGAAAVSIATYVAYPPTYVRFGILHLIAVCMVLLLPLRRLHLWNIPLGIAIVILGWSVYLQTVPTVLLIPLGMVPAGFQTVDYFPLLPWAGVVCIGMGLKPLLTVPLPRFRHLREQCTCMLTPLSWPGRHALLVYLLHQPILLAILELFYRLHQAGGT